MYQINISDLGIMTSVDPCLYSSHGGLNETFILTTIDGKTISSFHYETRDLEYIASREKRAKAKRLMLTPDFSAWKTKVVVQSNHRGAVKPVFYEGLKNYNALGGERAETRKKDGTAAPPPQEQSFFSKYWMYILMAMFILPRLLGDDPQPQGQEGGAAPQGAAPSSGARR